ncbi:hypothetical protein J8J14_08125 [Roseomonas sp. SSH11]|uniref:Uncharacterized protein n=1 Tax=Pararoseomonas baculiformis TaxID=2820812 RepID=A0ABS4ACK6_9PROT|nr:hypothetical protein [Pararoseomonas baculiformis]MBP0444749.1 hypothetical protein [Pararoseomonas baculiformis]
MACCCVSPSPEDTTSAGAATSILASIEGYEAFLRATYWRWAKTVLLIAPELASIHLGTGDPGEAIRQDFHARPANWLRDASPRAADAVACEYRRVQQATQPG